jgi:hypothetical protein
MTANWRDRLSRSSLRATTESGRGRRRASIRRTRRCGMTKLGAFVTNAGEAVREKLILIVAWRGAEIRSDEALLRGLLRDHCPEHPREVNLLLAAAREQIPARLIAASASPAGTNLVAAQLRANLVRSQGLQDTLAHWAVETWGIALGVLKPGQFLPPVEHAPLPVALSGSPAPETIIRPTPIAPLGPTRSAGPTHRIGLGDPGSPRARAPSGPSPRLHQLTRHEVRLHRPWRIPDGQPRWRENAIPR